MKFNTILFLSFLLSNSFIGKAQTPTSKNDTIFIQNDVNAAASFSKGDFKYLLLQNVIPTDIPTKDLKLELISSKSNVIDPKLFYNSGNDVFIPLSLLEERYYTLYIKKGKSTEYLKRIVIK